MKRLLAIAAAAAITAVASLPAAAQTYYDGPYQQNWRQRQHDSWNNSWNRGSNNGWTTRDVSGFDPSFGNRSGLNAARRTGRCVEDLGYGRFEYCGW